MALKSDLLYRSVQPIESRRTMALGLFSMVARCKAVFFKEKIVNNCLIKYATENPNYPILVSLVEKMRVDRVEQLHSLRVAVGSC